MKIDRQIGILSILLQRDKVTSQELADAGEENHHTSERGQEH